jgi:retron-type reverse transcriptase
MPRRSPLGLAEVASLDTLYRAFWRATLGKRDRAEVRRFAADLHGEIARLREEIIWGTVRVGEARSFRIFDPKPRTIHAPCFRERVLHHAIIQHVGPVLDRALVASTFACREGKGLLAAVKYAQGAARRFEWYVKADIRSFFASVDHAVLKDLVRRRLKSPGLLSLLDRLIDSHESPRGSGKGLPIGALTSQHFANYYLSPLDRFLLEDLRAGALARYMDDFVWWCRCRAEAVSMRRAVAAFVRDDLRLELRDDPFVQRTRLGLSFLGFRVFPNVLRLSRRRRRRYARARKRHEEAYRLGLIGARELQERYTSALAITSHADAGAWRRAELRRNGSLDA